MATSSRSSSRIAQTQQLYSHTDYELDSTEKKKRQSNSSEQTQSRKKQTRQSLETQNGSDEDADEETVDRPSTRGAKNEKSLYAISTSDLKQFDKSTFLRTIKGGLENQWSLEKQDVKSQCLKAVVRYLLFKGTKNETIRKANITDELGKIDSKYKTYCNVVLKAAQKVLRNDFGFNLVCEADLPPFDDSKKDNLFLVNDIKSPTVLSALAHANEESAYIGFTFVVFQAIFTAPGKKIDASSLLSQIRTVDSRFPETLVATNRSSKVADACPVPELGEDFQGLMTRMKKEGYVTTTKDDGDRDEAKLTYSLGPRFHLQMGKTRLLKGYYQTLGQEVDPHLLAQIEKEDVEEGEVEGGNGDEGDA